MLEEKIKKISLQEFAYPVTDKGIGEANTISNGPDGGGLDKLAACFWNAKRHGSTQQAIDNLLIPVKLNVTEEITEEFSASNGCNIGGHGAPGYFETGCGKNSPFDTNKYVIWNEPVWGPQFDRLITSPLAMLTIWACNVGADQDGADILYKLATHTGRAVRAGTAMLYSDGKSLWWGNKNQWQVATPYSKPTPIPRPAEILMKNKIEFQIKNNILDIKNIESIHILNIKIDSKNTEDKYFQGKDAQLKVQNMFTSSALDMKNLSVMGLVSAKLKINFSIHEFIEFDVYNNRLAVDEKSETGYYIYL